MSSLMVEPLQLFIVVKCIVITIRLFWVLYGQYSMRWLSDPETISLLAQHSRKLFHRTLYIPHEISCMLWQRSNLDSFTNIQTHAEQTRKRFHPLLSIIARQSDKEKN
jgi:hypothetical protein